jgi:hypothetical protein
MGDENNSIDNFYNQDEQYFKKEPQNYKEIVTRAISKCVLEGQKEFSRGGQIKEIINNEVVVRTIPNQRKVYINCIKSYEDLMVFFFDDIAKENINELKELLKLIYPNWLDMYLKQETDDNCLEFATMTGHISPRAYYFDYIMDMMELDEVEIWRKIFIELNLLFKRKKELSGKKTLSATESGLMQ